MLRCRITHYSGLLDGATARRVEAVQKSCVSQERSGRDVCICISTLPVCRTCSLAFAGTSPDQLSSFHLLCISIQAADAFLSFLPPAPAAPPDPVPTPPATTPTPPAAAPDPMPTPPATAPTAAPPTATPTSTPPPAAAPTTTPTRLPSVSSVIYQLSVDLLKIGQPGCVQRARRHASSSRYIATAVICTLSKST